MGKESSGLKKLCQTKLLRKYEKYISKVVQKRDGYKCQVAGYRHRCSERLVADHRPSKRGNHSTFIDIRNLTCVCSSANFRAEIDGFIAQKITARVIEREGHEAFAELEVLSKSPRKWTEEEIIITILGYAKFYGEKEVEKELTEKLKKMKKSEESPK